MGTHDPREAAPGPDPALEEVLRRALTESQSPEAIGEEELASLARALALVGESAPAGERARALVESALRSFFQGRPEEEGGGPSAFVGLASRVAEMLLADPAALERMERLTAELRKRER